MPAPKGMQTKPATLTAPQTQAPHLSPQLLAQPELTVNIKSPFSLSFLIIAQGRMVLGASLSSFCILFCGRTDLQNAPCTCGAGLITVSSRTVLAGQYGRRGHAPCSRQTRQHGRGAAIASTRRMSLRTVRSRCGSVTFTYHSVICSIVRAVRARNQSRSERDAIRSLCNPQWAAC